MAGELDLIASLAEQVETLAQYVHAQRQLIAQTVNVCSFLATRMDALDSGPDPTTEAVLELAKALRDQPPPEVHVNPTIEPAAVEVLVDLPKRDAKIVRNAQGAIIGIRDE